VFFPASYYQAAAKPKETFMAALGIPAVLSGALGTASTAESVSDLARDAERLRQAVREEQRIVKDGAFNVFEPVGGPAQAKPEASWLPIPFIAAAHAQSATGASEPIRFGVRLEQPRYVVVLKKSGSAQQAVQDAHRLQADLPAARAIRSDKGYFVVVK